MSRAVPHGDPVLTMHQRALLLRMALNPLSREHHNATSLRCLRSKGLAAWVAPTVDEPGQYHITPKGAELASRITTKESTSVESLPSTPRPAHHRARLHRAT